MIIKKLLKKLVINFLFFFPETILAQDKFKKIQGRKGIYFSGAWMRNGFHEDGILSTKKIIKQLLGNAAKNRNLIEVL